MGVSREMVLSCSSGVPGCEELAEKLGASENVPPVFVVQAALEHIQCLKLYSDDTINKTLAALNGPSTIEAREITNSLVDLATIFGATPQEIDNELSEANLEDFLVELLRANVKQNTEYVAIVQDFFDSKPGALSIFAQKKAGNYFRMEMVANTIDYRDMIQFGRVPGDNSSLHNLGRYWSLVASYSLVLSSEKSFSELLELNSETAKFYQRQKRRGNCCRFSP